MCECVHVGMHAFFDWLESQLGRIGLPFRIELCSLSTTQAFAYDIIHRRTSIPTPHTTHAAHTLRTYSSALRMRALQILRALLITVVSKF